MPLPRDVLSQNPTPPAPAADANEFADALSERGYPAPWRVSETEAGQVVDRDGQVALVVDFDRSLPDETARGIANLVVRAVNAAANITTGRAGS